MIVQAHVLWLINLQRVCLRKFYTPSQLPRCVGYPLHWLPTAGWQVIWDLDLQQRNLC